MSRIITKELAEKIVTKLEATLLEKGAHYKYGVFHEGAMVAEISIRHGSNKQQGHDFIPKLIHVGPNFARLLGQCPKSRADWIAELRQRGIIEAEEA